MKPAIYKDFERFYNKRLFMILMIDNYDSFTYNIVQYIGELGGDIKVFRNDGITLSEIKKFAPSHIVISPGPGCPDEAGISKDVIKEFSGKIPLLGVCLGHQCMGEVYGAKVVRAKNIMHGKVSDIYHNGDGVFKGIPSPFTATRYHSLIVDNDTVKPPLVITARTKDGEIMGLEIKGKAVFGVQFHPESILTLEGKKIFKNFLSYKPVFCIRPSAKCS
ncbi:anthranilate synthase subunit II [Candidatus Omnitrophus magneticus]|uniref:Anthranilate synthase subunit II n=1 Tax=Candidatus Omnitrophus magneticus TaxID=1609969 RepID=A0A0F0CNE4_9BACT|nr:anthranilate synthase subunit II [Candidatus Omnitrophus magneticus]